MKTSCTVSPLRIPTYPEPPREKLPQYCETRCHQRTSGRVYPNAIVKEVVRDRTVDREYTAIVLENDWIRLTILPEIGGRIFEAIDKTNGYDFFYRQHGIKPALIGLLGSWISGGAEFNWPLHHRPSTFLPCDYHIEEEADGSVTAWLSEHEPLDRMKGMVGIRVSPGKALFETRVRVFNRTDLPQPFLWWQNIAVPVNEQYQIFFPQDVTHVHFHRKQSVTGYPVTIPGMYNGKDYRSEPRDIRWHRNTPDATSYFSARSRYDFFGGYDHGRRAGVIHVADHHLSPGKKLFSWAYGQLSKSWEKALTDTDGPYAELMAGAYSDNQPDFTWLEPGEVKQFSQFWYPIKDLGEPLNATTQVALAASPDEGVLRLYAVEELRSVTVEVYRSSSLLLRTEVDLHPGVCTVLPAEALRGQEVVACSFRLLDASGRELLSFSHDAFEPEPIPEPRPSDPPPDALDNPEELYLAGLHMAQYRDPLTKPDAYWKRALELNPLHHLSHVGMGLSALREGRLVEAESSFREAIRILTRFNPNPRDAEAYYQLGLTLKLQGREDEAYDAFSKAVWNFRWRSPGHYALAQIDCSRGLFSSARTHLLEALEAYAGNQKARNLLAVVERKLGQDASGLVAQTLRGDPLDYWALNESGVAFFDRMASDPSQTILDVAFEYTAAGLHGDAADLLQRFLDWASSASPMAWYALGWSLERSGDDHGADAAYRKARACCPDYCFPSRIEEMRILQHVTTTHPEDARAAYYLGNLLYGKDQYAAATACWETALRNGEPYYVLLRNLGMARFNQGRDCEGALRFLREALEREPGDAQLVFDLCHLMQLSCQPVEERLSLLERSPALLQRRDDLYLEWVRAHNQRGDCERALELLSRHTFTPCEGGEHAVLEQYRFAHFALGRRALHNGDVPGALQHFQGAQVFPENLGAGAWNIALSAPFILQEGLCHEQLGENARAVERFAFLADLGVDFFSTMYLPSLPCYRAGALQRLGREQEARDLMEACLREWTAGLERKDYGHFEITPFFLSFLEPPERARRAHFSYLLGQAWRTLGDVSKARRFLLDVLDLQPGHLWAALELSLLPGPPSP